LLFTPTLLQKPEKKKNNLMTQAPLLKDFTQDAKFGCIFWIMEFATWISKEQLQNSWWNWFCPLLPSDKTHSVTEIVKKLTDDFKKPIPFAGAMIDIIMELSNMSVFDIGEHFRNFKCNNMTLSKFIFKFEFLFTLTTMDSKEKSYYFFNNLPFHLQTKLLEKLTTLKTFQPQDHSYDILKSTILSIQLFLHLKRSWNQLKILQVGKRRKNLRK
jgi:hypothetical protein